MTEFSPRSYLRDANGPRVVEADRERTRASRYGRPEDEKSHKSRRSSDKKSRSKPEQASWQKLKPRTSNLIDKPSFRLDVINQPLRAVTLGIEVSMSVLASVTFPSVEAAAKGLDIDNSRLIGVASLVAETSSGDRIPMETDAMVAQQLVDSMRSIPGDCAERITQAQPCRVPLGYFSFSDMLIRQSGYYRIRVSLIQIPGAGRDPMTITTLDSELIKVERRSLTSQQRWQQRSQM